MGNSNNSSLLSSLISELFLDSTHSPMRLAIESTLQSLQKISDIHFNNSENFIEEFTDILNPVIIRIQTSRDILTEKKNNLSRLDYALRSKILKLQQRVMWYIYHILLKYYHYYFHL